MKKRFASFLTAVILAMTASAQIQLSTENSSGALPIVTSSEVAVIVTDKADAEVVATAADCVAHDLQAVTGKALTVSHSLPKGQSVIIAGTVGQSPLVDALIAKGKVDASKVSGKWEAYSLQMVEKPQKGIRRALVIIGSTPRGTAYGLFELSRLAGVSPWIWWADVTPKKKATLYATGTQLTVGEPSVKYRGIFINDEDFALFPWASKGIDKQYNNIGPNTYARVMELLLRLRANTLWPAMHLCSEAFWANKDNLPVAKRYDIMLGSSHCEQMLRDNEWEWRHAPWNGVNEDWNYVTNKKKIQTYWEERVKESVGYDGMYTLGMRGVHDWGISGYPTTEDKVRGLTEIIGYQRDLLGKYFDDVTKVPQLFIPYKEVLDAYNAGLQVPEDVTLCWVDDNHGYIRQLPKPAEQARSGGNGVYYHVSYWGTPADYLWIASHSPSLMSYELSRAYDQGIRTLWVINVGDIKPAEMELEFCMDLAWDVNQWTPENAIGYSRAWAAKTFGEAYADEIAAIKRDYYRLAAGGKPEHLHIISYSNDDKDRRISEYESLVERVDALKRNIPADLQDAFFQLIEYPVKGAYYMNVKTFRAAQSIELGNLGHRDRALQYAADARKAYSMIEQLTNQYNNDIAGGKWNGMMNFKPRGLEHFNMPATVTPTSIRNGAIPLSKEDVTVIPAAGYKKASPKVKTIEGLGINKSSLTVWPLDMTAYNTSSASAQDEAPFVEYEVPVKKGKNHIEVRCLSNFPINTNYDLRVALTVLDGSAAQSPVITSLKTMAMEGKWHTTVAQGYNDAAIDYVSGQEKTVTLRIALLDPGVVVSEIRNTVKQEDDLSLTKQLIKNYDFEYGHNGELNVAGQISRGIPYGWQSKGELKQGANRLQSYGVNQDATNLHGVNVCWVNSVPMPDDFWLYQTIPASKLEPGLYRVSCRLWVEGDRKTNCRLFANNEVQYYGHENDYTHLLSPGENATYAGHVGGNASNIVLRDMEVYVNVTAGEDLCLGIKTSNKRNSGERSTNDNAGWFKVDFFRIDRIGHAASHH
ncbi:MAG: glycosyl hydrolase 115 family protein [Prevotella sp.]|nr:glycosyl hydrolase 115 family protein [Prevotella sp.]